ncbi:AI-2E family transporter [Clostridium felsineum]|uniref:Uncharacterized protein n=1 Tax=Clostridium felsineum TaxID=36839 RepID=A0A1S8MCI5_9CLOT|nr:AI-2E family transporter [Clostridium felsineum]MCR3761630.1 AI-2E family transporter [Clostridium felsineum]URZ07320.1 hypothetical protein CLROS_026580 [Clostridium felsineum]URZ12351.1 hypothetical protein CROST_030730 [Clostridium felsineum]
MSYIIELFHKESFKRGAFLVLLAAFFYFCRSIMNFILLTFLITYLISSLHGFVVSKLSKFVKVKEGLVAVILYIIIIAVIVLVFYNYVPIIIRETTNIINQATDVYNTVNDSDFGALGKYIQPILDKFDIGSYTKQGLSYLIEFAKSFGKVSLNLFLAFVLSLFFVLEKKTIKKFGKKFEKSKLATMYGYFVYYGNNFLNSFGKVIKAQILIAMVNAILSSIALAIMGFPNLMTLGVMIFVLSLIPVAGVIISLVPLSLIAFNINGFTEVIYVILMVIVIHCIESYFLNPKLMSSKTKIPIFFTFIILIVSGDFMGTWGLLLGIPLFMFVLDVFEVKVS